jgi:DNA-binding transcriptional MerR regulator
MNTEGSTYLNNIEDELKKQGFNLKQVEMLYPKLYDPIMNLSITGITPRTYIHWKEKGLIHSNNDLNSDKGWVKINLIDFVWIKIIEAMRRFGVPLEVIKDTKDLMYTDFIDALIDEKDDYINYLRKTETISEDKIKLVEYHLNIAKMEKVNEPEEFKSYHSLLGQLILELLLKHDKGYITIAYINNVHEIGYYSLKTAEDFRKNIQEQFEYPILQIPIKKILEAFIEEDKTEKYLEPISFLNLKEMKVIDAIRDNNFKEIVIRKDNKNETITIYKETESDIINQKAKEIKRLLGLNEYSEVTLKYRNDKHLYFKTKTRI